MQNLREKLSQIMTMISKSRRSPFHCVLMAGTVLGLGISLPMSNAAMATSNLQSALFSLSAPNWSQDLRHSVVSDQVVSGAQNFVESMAQRGLDFLADEKLTKKQKKSAFSKLLSDSFAMKTLARFSLGRYWRVASPEERREYLNLFEKMIIDVYSSRFGDYQGQSFDVRKARSDNDRDVVVSSFIVPQNGSEIQVDWRVRYKNKKYRVVDVVVEGVSMAVTQRSDFSAVIQRGGGKVQVLLTHLRK